MNVLTKIAGLLALFGKYLPYVNSAVKDVEASVSGAPGSTKKELAVAAVLALAHSGESVPVGAVAIVSSLVDVTVTALNGLGVFGHSTSTPPAPPAA
jgi:hypothetical protein